MAEQLVIVAAVRHSVACWLTALLLSGCAGPEPSPQGEPGGLPERPAPSFAEQADPAGEQRRIEQEARQRQLAGGTQPPMAMDLHGALVACRVLVLEGRYGEAAKGYQELVRVWPDALLPRIGLARLAVAGGDFEVAEQALGPVLSRVEQLPDGNYLAGVALLHGVGRDEGIRRLREELADGEFCADAALELAAHFASRELHGEAMSVIAAARSREPDDLALAICAARLRFDTCRWTECRVLVDELMLDAADEPQVLLLLADVAQCQGDTGVSLDALEKLTSSELRAEPFVADRIETLELRIEALRALQPGDWPPLGADALLALLRGSEQLSQRLAAYEALSLDPRTAEVATAVALRQDEPLLRVAAVKTYRASNREEMLGVCLALAEDPDPRVRGALAIRAGSDLEAGQATRFLLAQLAVEEDAYAFGCTHEALTRVVGAAVHLSTGAAADAAVRARVREEWRKLCPE